MAAEGGTNQMTRAIELTSGAAVVVSHIQLIRNESTDVVVTDKTGASLTLTIGIRDDTDALVQASGTGTIEVPAGKIYPLREGRTYKYNIWEVLAGGEHLLLFRGNCKIGKSIGVLDSDTPTAAEVKAYENAAEVARDEALAAETAAEAAQVAAETARDLAQTAASAAQAAEDAAETARTGAEAAEAAALGSAAAAETAETGAEASATSATNSAQAANTYQGLAAGYFTGANAAKDAAGVAQGEAEASAFLSRDWATKMAGTVDGVDYSAKYWAKRPEVLMIGADLGGSNTIGTVAAELTAIQAVAAISTEVEALGEIAQAVSVVSESVTQLGMVAGSIASVNIVAARDADIGTLAPIAGNITTVVGSQASVVTVAGVADNVTTVAGIAPHITTLAPLNTEIAALGPRAANITTVAGIEDDVVTVAGIAPDVTTVADNMLVVQDAADDLNDINIAMLQMATAYTNSQTRYLALTVPA